MNLIKKILNEKGIKVNIFSRIIREKLNMVNSHLLNGHMALMKVFTRFRSFYK